MHIVDDQTNGQLYNGNNGEEYRGISDVLFKRCVIGMMMKGYFFESRMLHSVLISWVTNKMN
jgi:hypothetical protein